MQTRRTKWDEKREASYDALVASAMRCFHERGYAATRVEDIVEGAGYTSGAFYFHFKNKTDCFAHTIAYRDRLRGDWPTDFLDDLDPARTSLEQVLTLLFAHFARTESDLTAWVLVMVDYHQQHRHDPDARALLADTYARWHAQIARFLTELQRRGWIAPDRDPDRLAREIFAYTEGTVAHASLYGIDRGESIDGLVRLLR